VTAVGCPMLQHDSHSLHCNSLCCAISKCSYECDLIIGQTSQHKEKTRTVDLSSVLRLSFPICKKDGMVIPLSQNADDVKWDGKFDAPAI
jgi:hypothetical protein